MWEFDGCCAHTHNSMVVIRQLPKPISAASAAIQHSSFCILRAEIYKAEPKIPICNSIVIRYRVILLVLVPNHILSS